MSPRARSQSMSGPAADPRHFVPAPAPSCYRVPVGRRTGELPEYQNGAKSRRYVGKPENSLLWAPVIVAASPDEAIAKTRHLYPDVAIGEPVLTCTGDAHSPAASYVALSRLEAIGFR